MRTLSNKKFLVSAVLFLIMSAALAACGSDSTPAATATTSTTVAPIPTFTPNSTTTTTTTTTVATTSAATTTIAPATTTAANVVATTPANLPTLGASDITTLLQQASSNFASLQSLHFLMVIKQGKVQINGTDVQQVDADLQQPAKYQAQVKVNTFLGSFSLPVVGINGKQYMKNELGGWGQSSADQTVNLSAIFDKTSGLAPTILKMQNVQVLGNEMLNGVPTYHLQGTVAAADITQLSFNKLGQHPVTFDLWLSSGNAPQIQQLYIKEIDAGTNTNFWTFQFSKFNENINIQSPV